MASLVRSSWVRMKTPVQIPKKQGAVSHAWNPSTVGAETGGCLKFQHCRGRDRRLPESLFPLVANQCVTSAERGHLLKNKVKTDFGRYMMSISGLYMYMNTHKCVPPTHTVTSTMMIDNNNSKILSIPILLLLIKSTCLIGLV